MAYSFIPLYFLFTVGGLGVSEKYHKNCIVILLITRGKIELAKRIHNEMLKSSHPNQGVGLLGPRGLRVMTTGSQGIKSYAYWVQGGQGAGYRVPVGGQGFNLRGSRGAV